MADEAGFLAAIAAAPADDTLRLVYADWLDEQRDEDSTRKANFLRLQSEIVGRSNRGRKVVRSMNRLRKSSEALPAGWLGVVGRLPIENCPATGNRIALPINPEFAYECPKEWADLKPTDQPAVRACDSCRQNVFFCESIREARTHAVQGHCVAVNLPLPRSPGDLREQFTTMGIMLFPDADGDAKL